MTTQIEERIQRFEHMATADPDNDMAHFSLGGAYLEAGRAAEAAASLERCLALNPDMSKAYQLAGDAMLRAGWEDRGVAVLERGYRVAASKGDLMPKRAIADLLAGVGRAVPEIEPEVEAAAARLQESGAFICRRTGRPGTKLASPPMRGPIGAWIVENISAETWQEWIEQGTKVINELRLDFSRLEDQATYDQHMHEFLGLTDDVLERLGAS